jgi:apolipoprotein N-acyltransferase
MATKIISQKIDFELPGDREIVILLAQVPVRLRSPKPPDSIYKHENPSKQWKLVKEILTKVKDATFEREHTVDIILFPELSIPFSDENRNYILDYVKKEIEPPFIGIFPFDNIDLEKFSFILKKS